MNYYNTTHEHGEQLKMFKAKASKQDDEILRLFRNGTALSPFEVQGLLKNSGFDWPLTSIRRAITNLEHSGILEKLESKRMGGYGRMNYLWKIA